MNAIATFWFVVTVGGVFYCGLAIVLPHLYAGSAPWVLTAHYWLCYFLLAEMMVNWFCIRLIDSTFLPELFPQMAQQYTEPANADGLPAGRKQTYVLPDTQITIPVSKTGIDRSRIVPSDSSPRHKKGTLYLVKIPDFEEESSESETAIEEKRKLVYPYWSWKPCLICKTQRPPRVHHCPICSKCVLKRDHHCFFTGTCIGLNNQRHFTVFTFWAGLATSYSLVHAFAFIFGEFIVRNSWLDLLYPVALLRHLAGYVSFADQAMVLLMYSLVFFCITSLSFFVEQIRNIRHGMTDFEADNNIKVVSTLTTSQHMRSVFGEHWLWNFLIPLHFWFRHPEDGVTWPHVKA